MSKDNIKTDRQKGKVFFVKKLLLLINPVTGKRALEDDLMRIIDIFSQGDYDTTVHLTKSAEDMTDTVKNEGAKYDVVVCCGGDGTLNMVSGAVYSGKVDTVVGYIPGGTTNDFANTRNISTVVTGAAQQIVEGPVRDIDLGFLNGHSFIYVAAFGMFSELSYLTTREKKQNMGYAAYLLGGIKSFAQAKPFKLRIEYDGQVMEDEFIYGMVTNSRRVGGMQLPIIKNVLYDDGEMEITLVKQPKNPADTQKLINCLITQLADEYMVYSFKTSKMRITSDTEVPWSLDGEFGGSHKEMNVEVKGAAIKMKF
ncbi:MAG: diacylglycerol kinase family lipid kinase [Clostridia bacterium]|nr:diacylglycerol kinase family lipid kinase [Clostridia bacterium]